MFEFGIRVDKRLLAKLDTYFYTVFPNIKLCMFLFKLVTRRLLILIKIQYLQITNNNTLTILFFVEIKKKI